MQTLGRSEVGGVCRAGGGGSGYCSGVCVGVRTAASTRRGEVNGFEGLVAAASS